MSEPSPSLLRSQAMDTTPLTHDPRGLGRLYRLVSLLGILLASLGVIAELLLTSTVRDTLIPFADLGPDLLSLQPAAYTTLGIWTILAGPILGLLSLLLSGLQARSPRRTLLSLAVLFVVLLSFPIKACL